MATKMGLKGCMKLLEKMSVLILDEIAASNYSSLFNDFVESELFLIDGDSLFITCLNDEKLKAGQNLHFFYLVERYLLDLRSKGGQFIVVFFKDFEHSYFETPELLSLRTALILHLQKNTDINIQSEFSGCFSQEWNCFLEENCPYFLLVSDEGMTSLQTYLFYFYIIHSWSMKISTALISGQKLDILRVHAYFMLSRYKNQLFFKQEKNQMKTVYQTLIEHLKTSSAAALTPLFDQLPCDNWEKETYWSIGQLQALWPKGSDIQRVLCVLSCSLSLKMYQNFLEKEKKTSSAIDTSEKHLASVEEVKDLCRMYCLSVVFLLHLPLSQRACTRLITSSWKNSVSTFLKMKKWCEFFVLKNLDSSKTWNVDFTHVCDTNDDQLWKNIVYYYEKESIQGLHLELGKAIEEDYKDLWSAVSHLVREFDVGPPLPLRVTIQLFLQNTYSPIKEETQEKMPNLGFIPMTSPIVKKFAGDILDQVPFLNSDDPVVTSLVKYKEFHELVHWHSHKPLSDHYERTKSFTDGKSPYFLKSIQKLQTFQQHFGNSLEGTTSKIIVTQSVQPKKDFVAAKKNKKSQKSKADIIIKENNNRLLAKEEQKESERWKTLSSSIEGEMKENFHSGITKLEDFLKSCKSNSVKFSVEMIGLNASLNAWREHCQGEGRVRKDFNIAIHMMKRIHSIMDKYQEFLQEPDKKKISRCLKYLGFDNLARTLDPTQVMEKDKNSKKVNYALNMGPARFQLQYMGHYLFRDERKDPDPRVKDFIPDTWQRELLDVVDNNESAVIVAPTSSGKTYASYYCMEKVLRESDDGVIVYVAPTKALVNQVSTTVQSRFTKHLPEGQVLCGVFTRDYRHYALNCQVLVTVPACFEILLLSPNRQEWVEKIRYVIFDEVHCLGGQIGAEIWEHLLVMIRCPFLALSATINNPKHLTEWLQSVKRYWQEAEKSIDDFHLTLDARRVRASQRHLKAKKSYRVRLVLYEDRYNDLEKYVCSLQDGDIAFHHYHPCATLTPDHIEKYGFPSDLALSPRESIQLYDVMVKVWKTWPKAQELCPEEFVCFKNKIVITKMDAKKYEIALKEEISNWIQNGNITEAKQVLKILRPAPINQSDDMNHIFPFLVEKLRKMDKLPALFFMFNISVVEERARRVCKALEEKQERRQSANAVKEIHVLTNKLKKVKKSMEKTPTVPENALKRSSRMDQSIVREAEHMSLLKMLEKKTEIPPDCTYANPKMIDEETLQMLFDRIKSQRKGQELTQLSRRGIGYHHGALSARERQFIEVLFRKGFLRVVTATSTLALGINMPCKSVVFTQNSIYLDALNYRQMSGRAGRRGQDFLGNVFFYNISLPKIEKLIKSNVPELKGQFPFGMSLVLRLMLLASKADNIPDANAKVLSVLTHSLLSFKNPRIQEMLKLYFLFSMQLLVKEGYLDCEGNPIGFAGLVSHLFYQEPSNFLFVSFLKKGLFHNLCQPTKKGSKRFSQDVMEKLTLVLANLFGRMYIPAKLLGGNLKFYQSKVFLEDLPTDFDAALLEHNTKVIRDFSQFLLIVSKFADMKQEYQLPLSKIEFTGKRGATSQLASHLMSCKESRSAVSPFVCLSGVTNQDLLQVKNIDSIILRTIGVTSSQAPVLYLEKVDTLGRRLPLNAYVLDFYKHGSLKGIEQDNRINEGEAYVLLKDFSLILQSISVSLRELCEDETDNVVLAFEQLSESFKEKLDKV